MDVYHLINHDKYLFVLVVIFWTISNVIFPDKLWNLHLEIKF